MSAAPFDEGVPLAQAMTRPTTILGLTIQSLMLSLTIPVVAFMVTGIIYMLLLAGPLLLASYLLCLKDVYMFNILMAMSANKSSRNTRIWGCKTYAPR